MRVIFLAAEQASLLPFHRKTPKCLLEVGGRTILSRAIGALVAHGLRRFTIVDGFQGDHLRADVLAEFPAEWFEFVRDAAFATVGDGHSLLLTRAELPEPVFVLDSDIVFDRRVVGRMLAKGPADRRAARDGRAIGLSTFSAETATELFRVLERRVREERRVDEGYDASIMEMTRDGHTPHVVDLQDLGCMKIETAEDLARARWLFGSGSTEGPKPRAKPNTTSHSFSSGPDSTAPSTGK